MGSTSKTLVLVSTLDSTLDADMKSLFFLFLTLSIAKASFLDFDREVIDNPEGDDECVGVLVLFSPDYEEISVHDTIRKVQHEIIGAKVNGNCCWKIYGRKHFRGRSETLYPGFLDETKFEIVRSVKKIEC